MAIVLVSGSNADTILAGLKEEIDISLSLPDIAYAGYEGKLRTNYTATELLVTIPTDDYINSSSYYTPIYKEELNYDAWLQKINKNFQELD